MIARLQRLLTAGLFLAAIAWGWAWWRSSPAWALAGPLLLLAGYALAIGIEFAAMWAVNRGDPSPSPSARQLLAAWASEVSLGPRVFCWRQPFFSQAVPDHLPPPDDAHPRPGIVFIHGFVCNRGFWTPWLRRLHDSPAHRHRAFLALNLEPLLGDIDDYAPLIEAAVTRMEAATGRPPVLVCHSMGGLAARGWLRRGGIDAQGRARVAHIFTIGSPHGGTWLGRFSHAHNGRQMRLASGWLDALGRQETPSRRGLFTCFYSNCDNIVFPASTACLAGADNRAVHGAAHVAMAFDPRVVDHILRRIEAL